ncbi:MAG: hypothetical protein V1907_00895 [Candidatus Kerfeldbacteria bacterium]
MTKQWQKENERLASRFREILDDYYRQRTENGEILPDELRLVEAPQGIYGAFRIESGSQERISGLSKTERAKEAAPHREEMRRLTAYLKERFLG